MENMMLPEVLSGHGGGVKPIPTIVPTPTEYQTAGEHGFRTLWVVFVILVVSSAVFAGRSWKIPVNARILHVITTLITVVSALAYFAAATGQATSWTCTTVTDTHDHGIPDTHHEVCRQVFWGKYVAWALTGPLILIDLSLFAGIDGAHTFLAVVANLISVLSGLFATFGREHTAQKWGWFAIGAIAYLFVVWHVAVQGARVVSARDAKVKKLFYSLAGFTFVLFTVYPIVWAITDGTRKATVDTEIIAFAVLDVLTQVVFGTWLLISYRKNPETNIEVGGYWSRGLSSEGGIRIGDEEYGA